MRETNDLIALGVGVLSSIFKRIFGNFLRTSYRVGIFYPLELMVIPLGAKLS